MNIKPGDIEIQALQALLQGAVIPRPIALVSSINSEGEVNLSPFSFFNLFGVNPPVLVFSPARRVRDNTTKHTLDNVADVPEVVINIVSYSIVQQTSLASTEYERGVNEFLKAGFTPISSEEVRPPRVEESPVAFECKVIQIVPVGNGPGSGNLVFCEILRIHVKDSVLIAGRIDPFLLDAVARCGGDWYCRVQEPGLFTVPKPLIRKGIGIDGLPDFIRQSPVLTGNELGLLGNQELIPTPMPDAEVDLLRKKYPEFGKHQVARILINSGEIERAFSFLVSGSGTD